MANILLELRNEKMKREEILFESENGISCYILLFDKYEFNFSKNIFYFKNTINEAIKNADKILNLIEEKSEGKFYDDWSLQKISQITDLFHCIKQKFSTINPNYFIVADYITSVLHYKYEYSVRKPLDYINSFQLWLNNLLQGNFNYLYLNEKECIQINFKIDSFKENIKNIISLNLISLLNEPTIITINKQNKIIKFSLIIHLNENDIGKNVDEVLYPILSIIKDYNFGYEKGELHKQDSMEIIFYFIKSED